MCLMEFLRNLIEKFGFFFFWRALSFKGNLNKNSHLGLVSIALKLKDAPQKQKISNEK